MQRHLVQSTSRAILPCSSPFASTSSARPFSSTPSTHAKLKAERLQKGNDPMDMANLQDFKYDDVPYQSHLNLEKDREKLHLLRLMKFQLPEMQKLQKPYVPKDRSQMVLITSKQRLSDPLHPSSRKAVLTIRIHDLQNQKILQGSKATHKFKLLAGPRYNPSREEVKISSEELPTFLMNKKWCSDALDRLLAESNNMRDDMADIPVDLSHYTVKEAKKGKRRATLKDFPLEWLPRIPTADSGSEAGKSQA